MFVRMGTTVAVAGASGYRLYVRTADNPDPPPIDVGRPTPGADGSCAN